MIPLILWNKSTFNRNYKKLIIHKIILISKYSDLRYQCHRISLMVRYLILMILILPEIGSLLEIQIFMNKESYQEKAKN